MNVGNSLESCGLWDDPSLRDMKWVVSSICSSRYPLFVSPMCWFCHRCTLVPGYFCAHLSDSTPLLIFHAEQVMGLSEQVMMRFSEMKVRNSFPQASSVLSPVSRSI